MHSGYCRLRRTGLQPRFRMKARNVRLFRRSCGLSCSARIASKPDDLFVVLKNGLTLLVHQQPGAEVVSAQVFVRAGSALEGKYMRAGLSHYLEHVVAGGTTRSFTEEQAKERIHGNGRYNECLHQL